MAKLTAADAAASDNFGRSVAIAGDTVVVGAHAKNSDRGAVYVFRTSDGGATYGQVAKLTAADAAANDWFGISVVIDGDTVVVGASQFNSGQGRTGLFTPDMAFERIVKEQITVMKNAPLEIVDQVTAQVGLKPLSQD